MLLTKANKAAAIALVEGPAAQGVTPFPDAVRKRLLNSAIKMYGTNKAGRETFTGSGAIFNVDATAAYILSAAHNVMIWAGLNALPANWNDYVSDFGNAMSIAYGNVDMTFNKAPIGTGNKAKNTVTAPPLQNRCGNRANCLYDVLIIKSTDAGLRTYAQNYVFGGASFSEIATLVTKEGTAIKTAPNSFLQRDSYYFVQLGYGNISDDREKLKLNTNTGLLEKVKTWVERSEAGTGMVKGQLHYRIASPSYKQSQSAFDQAADVDEAPAYDEYADAITLRGPMSNCTAEGDSGGPLYAVDKAFNGVYLIGVASGADMLPSQDLNTWVFKNVICTSVAPYYNSIY